MSNPQAEARKNYENYNARTDENNTLLGYTYTNPYTNKSRDMPIDEYKRYMGIGQGGSRRRTVYRMHKSHRKSKRVRHTRRKQTRRHRHSRRR